MASEDEEFEDDEESVWRDSQTTATLFGVNPEINDLSRGQWTPRGSCRSFWWCVWFLCNLTEQRQTRHEKVGIPCSFLLILHRDSLGTSLSSTETQQTRPSGGGLVLRQTLGWHRAAVFLELLLHVVTGGERQQMLLCFPRRETKTLYVLESSQSTCRKLLQLQQRQRNNTLNWSLLTENQI